MIYQVKSPQGGRDQMTVPYLCGFKRNEMKLRCLRFTSAAVRLKSRNEVYMSSPSVARLLKLIAMMVRRGLRFIFKTLQNAAWLSELLSLCRRAT